VSDGSPEVLATRLAGFAPGQLRLVEVDGARVALARVADQVYALGDTCPHRGGSLSVGRLSGHRLACPLHGWMFDVRTGECVFPGRGARVPRYRVRVDGEEVWVAAEADR
jgi:nitrite reductase/ring-hydroxylating ferredoxin subunit